MVGTIEGETSHHLVFVNILLLCTPHLFHTFLRKKYPP